MSKQSHWIPLHYINDYLTGYIPTVKARSAENPGDFYRLMIWYLD